MTQENKCLPASPTSDQATDTTWSRRRLLKELAKGHGVMAGLMVLPGAWSKPLMEFASVGVTGGLSAPPAPKPCMTGNLVMRFGNTTPSANVQFNVYYWGVDQYSGGSDVNAVINTNTKTLTLQVSSMTYTLVSISQSTLGTIANRDLTIPLSAITGTFQVSFSTSANTRSFSAPATENITLDFTLTQGTSPTLTVGNPKSSRCA